MRGEGVGAGDVLPTHASSCLLQAQPSVGLCGAEGRVSLAPRGVEVSSNRQHCFELDASLQLPQTHRRMLLHVAV